MLQDLVVLVFGSQMLLVLQDEFNQLLHLGEQMDLIHLIQVVLQLIILQLVFLVFLLVFSI
jgi:hypothetical protein